MRAEIAEQPLRWLELLERQTAALHAAAELATASSVTSVVFVARGTSDHAATYGQYLCQTVFGRRAALATPSVSSLLGRDLFDPTTLVVAVSQSGASPDLVATIDSARRSGAPTLSFTNDASSDLARVTDVHVDVCAGEEMAVAATKSYTAELVGLHGWLRLAAGRPMAEICRDVEAAAAAAPQVVARATAVAERAAAELAAQERVLVIGRGYGLATARESALKLIETCAIAASGWSAADAKHGPLGQVVAGTPVFLLGGSRFGRESVLALAPDVLARGGRVYPVGVPSTDSRVEHAFSDVIPEVSDALVPTLEIIPFQLLALELALVRGKDPDRPVGLTKVTHTL